MARFVRLVFATALLLALAPLLRAESVSQLKPTGYVNDFAHVLSPDASVRISNLAQQIDRKAQAQIALVTINTLDGRDIESYAVDLFKQWGIGKKGTDRGVLILYAIQDHRARIEVGYGLEPILPDGKVGSFQREAIPQMRSGDYSGALLLVTSRVADVIAKDAGVEITGTVPARAAPSDSNDGSLGVGIFWLIALGLFIFFRVFMGRLSSRRSRRNRWWHGGGFGGFGGLGGGWGGGSSGGWGGGGGSWGGFSGGGGFGGFGGGSSGGGGASSGW